MQVNKKLILIIVLIILGAIFWLLGNVMQQGPKIAQPRLDNEDNNGTPVFNKQGPKVETEKSPLGEFNPAEPEKTAPLSQDVVKDVANDKGVVQLSVSSSGFSPKEFTVRPGQTVSLVVKAVGNNYVLQFKAPLSNIRVGLSVNETRGISFIAPKAGNYIFYREIPGYENEKNPATGVMHVK